MGLFGGKPKALRDLQAELMAAHTAYALSGSLSVEHQERVAATAPQEIAAAVRAAALAGHGAEARQLLEAKRQAPPKAFPHGATWDQVIDAGLAALSG